VVRRSVYDIKTIRQAKKAIRAAFEVQLSGGGFSMVEFLSPCPTNWKMTPVEAFRYLEERMEKEYPLGVFKDITKD